MSFFCLPLLHEVAALLRNSHLELSKLKTCQGTMVEASGDLLHSPCPAEWISFIHQGAHAPEVKLGGLVPPDLRFSAWISRHLRILLVLRKKKKKKKILPCAQNGFPPNFVFVLPSWKKVQVQVKVGQNICRMAVKKLTSPEWFVCSITHYKSNQGWKRFNFNNSISISISISINININISNGSNFE